MINNLYREGFWKYNSMGKLSKNIHLIAFIDFNDVIRPG